MPTKYGAIDNSFPKEHEKVYKKKNGTGFFGRNGVIKTISAFIYADIYGDSEKESEDKKSVIVVPGFFTYP